ncbi:MAG: lytic transglycosylase domain-containing protein [Acidimicrobiia bacterium]|nr:lytic transglycosylase domain-containing protein [Acidimicrobiia bacterium]
MTVAALQSVASRVGEIQSRIDRITPSAATFAEALEAAQEVPTDHFVVAAAGNRSSEMHAYPALPIGMLGTPVMLRSGLGGYPQLADGSWVASLPAIGQAWAPEIERAAANAGIDPRLLAAMVWQESGFRPDAVSRSGAVGLTQLMPATAAGLDVDPADPLQNLAGGARYLAWTIEEFGSIELGLAAYNAGPGTVRRAGGIPEIPETQAYVPRVIEYYRQLGGVA